MQHRTRAIITGHSQGLGASLAEILLEQGIPVLGCARKTNPELAKRFPAFFGEHQLDLGETADLAAWLDGEEIRRFCSDAETLLVINNAGRLGPIGPLETQDLRDIGTTIAVNVAAPLMTASAVARHHAGDLRILHISSGAARVAYAGWSVYCATKAALDHHARATAADGRQNLRICSLAPGVVDTDMQVTVRNSTEAHFPMLKKFHKLKQEGLLSQPRPTAEKIIAYLLGDSFGRAPTADIREIEDNGAN